MNLQYQMTHISNLCMMTVVDKRCIQFYLASWRWKHKLLLALVQNFLIMISVSHQMTLLLYHLQYVTLVTSLNCFTPLYYRLLPLILYKSHLTVRVIWLSWVLQKLTVRSSLWFLQQIVHNLFCLHVLHILGVWMYYISWGYGYYDGYKIVITHVSDVFTPCDTIMQCALMYIAVFLSFINGFCTF